MTEQSLEIFNFFELRLNKCSAPSYKWKGMSKMHKIMVKKYKKYDGRGRHLRLQHKRIKLLKSKLSLLKHISKKNCALLQYLDDESLHTLGEFIYNIIHQKVKLDPHQEKRVKSILKKDKDFYRKLIDKNTKDPLGYFRKSLKFDPQVGNGIVSLIAALAPLISSLIMR